MIVRHRSEPRSLRMRMQRDVRRSFWALAVGLCVLLSLSACAAALPHTAPERQIVVLWHTFLGNEAKALETLADDFNAENPWQILLVTEYQEDLLGKMLTVESGDAPSSASHPDLVTLQPEELQIYVSSGLVGALPSQSPELVAAWDDMLPMGRMLYAVGGVPQALPLGLATYLTYYNAEWMGDLGYEATGADWEDFRRTACAATDPLHGRVGVGLPARASILMAFLAARDADVVDAEGYYQFADDGGYATAAMLQAVMARNCGVIYEDWDRGIAELSKSSMAMMVESSQRLSDIEAAILSGRNFPLDLAPLPGNTGAGPTLWYGPGLMVSAPEGPRQEAALKVFSWFYSPAAQMTWGDMTTYLPLRRTVVEGWLADMDVGPIPSPEAQLWQLTLNAADSGAWFSWPLVTNRITCRASLLRGLLAFQREDADVNAYIDTAVTACNTGVGRRSLPTPAPTEAPAP
jgi:ABC-type glycerol-3-phosphate transport system substrate-binding protein